MTRREKRKFKKRKAREERIRQAKHQKRFGVERQRGWMWDLDTYRRRVKNRALFKMRKKAS